MICYLYSNNELLGWADLLPSDPSMGCVAGEFHPNENYSRVQPIIREIFIHNGTLGERNNEKLAIAFEAKDGLNLQVRTESGIVLQPEGPIFLHDFTSVAPELEILLDVCGLRGELEDVFGQRADS